MRVIELESLKIYRTNREQIITDNIGNIYKKLLTRKRKDKFIGQPSSKEVKPFYSVSSMKPITSSRGR